MSTSAELRRAGDGFVTVRDGVTSRHSFSFGRHYDAGNTSFGVLVAHNDDVLDPGHGYAEHSHRDVDIVSWVVAGSLRHTDDRPGLHGDHGAHGELGLTVVQAGAAQLLNAGTGVRHSEIGDATLPTRFVQMWIDVAPGGAPSYGSAAFTGSGFVVMASDRSPAPMTLRAPATFAVARLRAGETAALEGAAYLHLTAVGGRATITVAGLHGDIALDDGDTARITGATRLVVTADPQAVGCVDVLAWQMATSLGSDLPG